MSVLIHGLGIPQEGFVEVLIRDDGTVQQTGQSYRIDGTDYYTPYVGEMPVIYKAVPVPPHGRLIDADALKAEQQKDADLFRHATTLAEKSRRDEALNAVANIVNAPTIIPAEEE